MRNATKLKTILAKYDVNMHLDDSTFKMIIFDKVDNEKHIFEAPNWASLLTKALKICNKKYKQQFWKEWEPGAGTKIEQ